MHIFTGCPGEFEGGMGRRGGHGVQRGAAGELGVNKKGTPLYSKEDIREQYCINDKELEVLDKAGRRSILGCFSNQGQVRRILKGRVDSAFVITKPLHAI